MADEAECKKILETINVGFLSSLFDKVQEEDNSSVAVEIIRQAIDKKADSTSKQLPHLNQLQK